jgi:prevent-host-death family protein
VTTQVTATQAKAQLLGLLDAVASGEEVEITRHGRTVARLVAARGASAVRGSWIGRARSAATDEELFHTGEQWESS